MPFELEKLECSRIPVNNNILLHPVNMTILELKPKNGQTEKGIGFRFELNGYYHGSLVFEYVALVSYFFEPEDLPLKSEAEANKLPPNAYWQFKDFIEQKMRNRECATFEIRPFHERALNPQQILDILR